MVIHSDDVFHPQPLALIMRDWVLVDFASSKTSRFKHTVVLPTNAKEGVEIVQVKFLQLFDVTSVQNPGLTSKKEGRDNHNFVDFFSFVEIWLLCWLRTLVCSWPNVWLALLILVSVALSKAPLFKMMLPQYLKLFTFANWMTSPGLGHSLRWFYWGMAAVMLKLLDATGESWALGEQAALKMMQQVPLNTPYSLKYPIQDQELGTWRKCLFQKVFYII